MADAFAVAAALTLTCVLLATMRGWWIQGHADAAHTRRFEQSKGGEPDARLGLVSRGSLAGGKGSMTGSPCRYCGVTGGHAAWCPVVSFGVVR